MTKELKVTPGELSIACQDDGFGKLHTYIFAEKVYLVAEVVGFSDEHVEGNAHLLAASKDMYKTLTMLTLAFDKVHDDCENRELAELMGQLSTEIKLVLAKARGEIKSNEERL